MKFNERTASRELARTIEQNKRDDLRAINHQKIDDEAKRKQSANDAFWHRVWVSCNALFVMIIIYAAYRFFVG